MTKRDFFRLFIKAFGLYSCVTTIFYVMPQLFSNYMYDYDVSYFLIIIGTLLLVLALFFTLIFKANAIIGLLKLDEGFDDENIILGDLSSKSILLFSVTIIAGILIINGVPNFLFHLINAFKKEISLHSISNQEVNYFGLSTAFLNILIGFLLLTNNKRVAEFLNKS